MLYHTPAIVIVLFLCLVMVLVFVAGGRLRRHRIKLNLSDPDEGLGAAEGALLGLLALLLGFTFSMSNTRHDNRLHVLTQEANFIGTVILRADLFPDSARKEFRSKLREYLTARIDLYNAGSDPEKINSAQQHSTLCANSLWKMAAFQSRSEDVIKRTNGSAMLTALIDMSNAIVNRRSSMDAIIPPSILLLLFLLCISSAFIVGYGAKKKLDWILIAGFSVTISITVFAILDLDRPHRGLITLDKTEVLFLELRDSLKKD